MPVRDLVGLKVGRLTVIKNIGKRKQNTWWEVKCECGNKKSIVGASLTRKNPTKSCGCITIENLKRTGQLYNRKPPGVASINYLFSMYKRTARHRNLSFSLSKKSFASIIQSRCHYCNIEPYSISRSNSYFPIKYNGIDRKDPRKGYYKNNCVPSCKRCNYAKLKMSYKEFLDYILFLSKLEGEAFAGKKKCP